MAGTTGGLQSVDSSSSTSPTIEAELALLTTRELLSPGSYGAQLSRPDRLTKTTVIRCIVANAGADVIANLVKQSRSKHHLLEDAKRERAAERVERKRKRREEIAEERRIKLRRANVYDPENFLRLSTSEELKVCYGSFYPATSAATLRGRICAVCARECGVMDEMVTSRRLELIPAKERLRPSCLHPAHQLVDELLPEQAGIFEQDGIRHANFCSTYLHSLEDKKEERAPKHALANGTVPGLTVPEQSLIALLYPRVYVFKLLPKKNMGVRSVDQLQRAMRGSVSTYELNGTAIADMVKGSLMPILADSHVTFY